MYLVKDIGDSDFHLLLELHYELQKLLPSKLSRSQSAWQLLTELNNATRLILGLYKDDVLVGFVNGYSTTSTNFHFSNIFINKSSRFGTLKLLVYSENRLVNSGYSSWTCNSVLPEGIKMIKKFGGKLNG